MVVLGWSCGCLRVGLGLGFGWPYGVPGFKNRSIMENYRPEIRAGFEINFGNFWS